LAAVTAAAGLGTIGFAVPAVAQAPEPIETSLDFEGPYTAEVGPTTTAFAAEFGEDFTPGEHTVSMTLSIDIADDAFTFFGGDRCTANTGNTQVDCVQEDAPTAIGWEFEVAVADEDSAGSYPYTVELAVDGEVVHTEESEVAILPPDATGSWTPYAHAAFTRTGIEPGSTVEVTPEFRQDDPIPATAKAVVLSFGGSEFAVGVAVANEYDNCIGGNHYIYCAVTDFPNAPGTVYTISEPVSYTIDEKVPGPFDICNCSYDVLPVDDAEYQSIFGDFDWDEGSDNLIGLREADDPGTEFGDDSWGPITITTSKNPFDLAVDDMNIKGAKGTETTIHVEFTNDGPADTIGHPDGPGNFIVLVSLPTGVELRGEPDFCESPWRPEVYDSYLPELDSEVIEDADYVCYFMGVKSGETYTVDLEVEITSNRTSSDGTLAVLLGDDTGHDSDLTNNIAKFSLNARGNGNGDGNGNLPNTGTSLGLIIGIAALVVVAGVVMMVLTTKKRRATTDGASEE
jgi:hypothetical protein